MKKVKRFLALFLAVMMVLTSADFSAFAAENSANPDSKPANGTTENQPFVTGTTGGSTNFRIPAMVTLDSGRIVAAADARWNTSADGGGLDTIVSWSADKGKNWNYTVANYLGDNGNEHNTASTAFIDPVLATDGTNVYMVVDLWPAGYALNGATAQPDGNAANGFDDANGNLRLSGDDRTSYGYYLKKKDNASADDYYAIMQTGADGAEDTVVEGYTVDAYFNIKSVEETETTVSEGRDTAYSESDRFQFPDPGQTETLEAEYMVLEDDTSNNAAYGGTYPLVVEAAGWASNGKFVNSLNSGDDVVLYYNAPRTGTYTATVTYRSGSTSNGFSWAETDGKITAGSDTMGASSADTTQTGTIELVVATAGEGTLTITGGSSGGPQIDKIEIKAAFAEHQYSADDRFQFPDAGETKLLEAEYMVLDDDETNNAAYGGTYPLEVQDEEWASNGKFVNSLNSGDNVELYYNAPRTGTYTATVTYRSGSASNGFSWAEVSGENPKIEAGSVTMGANDGAGANHEGVVTFEVLEAGEGILRLTGGSSGGPQLDKIEFSFTTVPVDTNLFCADSPFKVYPTDYLYLTKSTDGGATWGAPTLINAKKAGEQSYLVGPGAGLVTTDDAGNKTIIIPCYVYDSGHERASFIYSKDDGATWTRTDDATDITSSEAQLVELSNGTLRCFFRNTTQRLCYVDAKWDAAGNEGKGKYVWGDVVQTDVVTSSYTQLSAISYSKRIDGKEAILVSCPTGPNEAGAAGSDENSRRNGKIFVGLVQKDGSMKWPYSMNVTSNEDHFLYSCMAELEDGSIGILYEPSMTEVTYANYTMDQIAPKANVTDLWVADAKGHAAESVVLKQGTSAEFTVKGVAEDAEVTVASANTNVATASLDDSNRTLTITAVAAADNAGISTAAVFEDEPIIGQTTVTVTSGSDEIVLDVTVDDFEQDVTISVGETVEIEGTFDSSSTYDSKLIKVEQGSYANPVVVDISTLEVGESTNMLLVTDIDGSKYVPLSEAGTSGDTAGLKLKQINENTDLSEYYWTVTGVAGGYTIQVASGEKQGYYITTNGHSVSLSESKPTVFSFEKTSDSYNISYLNSNNAKEYFNNFGGTKDLMAGWSYDSGSLGFKLWKTGTVITGLTVGGPTDVIVDGVTYHVTVEPAERYVTMYVGDKAIYDGQLESNTNESVINTEENDSSYPYDVATNIENGGKYLILNAPKNRVVDAISESSNKRPYVADVISDTVLANTYYSEHLWTFTLVENTTNEYYVQNADGKYLSIETNQNVNLVDHAEAILLTETSNSEYSGAWNLQSKTNSEWYLNNWGNIEGTSHVISYKDASPWYLYAPTEKDVTVVTAETVGTSDVTIGTTLYHITVKEPVGTYSDTVYVPEGETVEKRHGSAEPDITVSEGYDTAIVTAALSEDQATVSFTGVAEGRTVVDVGPMRYYVYVTKAVTESIASTEDVVVYVGQTKNLVSTENGHTPEIKGENFDKYLANYTLKGVHQDLLAVRGDTTISLNGNSAYYIGTPVDLSDCLYTFTNTGTANTYYITSVDANGQTVYVHHEAVGNGKANSSDSGQILLSEDGNGSFYLNDNTDGSGNRYLYFCRSGEKLNRLDAGNDSGSGYQFELYRPATAEEIAKNTDSAELPGYVKVSALTDIKDGGQYLIVASYTLDGNNYHYAVYPSLETNHNHTQTVQIITDPISGNKFSSVTFTGAAEGETTLQVDTKMYNITVLPKPDVLTPESTPFISETGQSAGSAVTKLTISADRTFDLTIGNGYPAENVTWKIIDDETGKEATWATVNPDGVVAFGAEADSTVTHNGRIVAEINGVPYEIPLRIAPKHTGTSSRSYDIYIKDLHHTDVYYGWIYQYTDENNNPAYTATTLVQAVEGAVLYVNLSTAVASAIDFFAEPEEGYVLTQMGATGSLGHYMKLDGTTPADTEFCTAAEGHETEDLYGGHPAGYQQLIRIDEAATTNLVGQAMAEGKECDGAQGFTRYAGNTDGLSTVLTYRSEKLPTVTKSVKGILGKDGLASSYRTYTDGMTAQVGEYVYFEVIVETYDAEDPITYTDVKLKDTLAGASFYEKDPDAEVQRPVYNMGSEIVITDAVGADGAAKTGNQHIYYAVYQIQEEDVAKQTITNHVELEYDYDSEYSTGVYHGAAAADAAIVVTDVLMDDIVIDFGLPVKNTCITNGRYFEEVSEPIATTYGTVTVTARETGETTDAVKQYENVVTYTPTGMLTGVDTVTLTLVDEADGTESSYTFYVYPASSVYYEEDFAEYSEGWTISGTATNTAQNLQRLSDAAAEPYGYDSHYADDPTGSSNGTEKVSETAGQTAEFTFAGTGIDIYANCQGGENPTGSVTVLIRNQETQAIEKLMIVNTIVAGNTTGVTNIQNGITNAYHLPIVSVNDLSQGEYGVKIAHTRTKTEVNAGKTYPVKLDGFRVYNTLEDQSVYADHEEANPFYVEMRDVVLNALSISDLYDGTEAETDLESIYAEDIAARLKQVLDTDATEAAAGIVMNSTQASGYEAGNAQDLLDNGPKNELFLYEGDTLAFKLLGGLQNVQIGLKAVNGPVSVSVSKQGETATAATTLAEPASITSSTDMFYVLGDMNENTVITIANTGENVLSVTDIKCFFGIGAVSVFGELSEDDFIPMLTNMGYSTKTETAPEAPEDTTVEDTTKEPAGNTDENQTTIGKEEASADDKKDTNTTEAVKPSATTGNSGAVNSADKNETEKPETVKITEVAEVSEDTDSSEEVKAPEELEASEPEEEQGSADVVVSDESEEGNGAVAAIGAVLVLAAAAAAVIFGLKKKRNR